MKKCNILKILTSGALVSLLCFGAIGCAAPKSLYAASSAPYEAPAAAPAEEHYYEDSAPYYEESIYNNDTFNTEEYSPITDNGYKNTFKSPLSTFSADVDTASYSNIRRMINDGMGVTKDAVRIEEMINYFDYDYRTPRGRTPFSVTTELAPCDWNKDAQLLLVGISGREIPPEEMPPSNIVFLLDVSGSMDNYDKLPLLQESFSLLTDNLNEQDFISIVTYAGDDKVVLAGARGNDKRKIKYAINSLGAGGSTAGSKGINTAYELAEEFFIEGGNNRVILATDGDLNVGITSEGDLKRLIESKRDSGVYLSVLGFGTDNIKDNKMETLADNGNGNYFYIDSMREAKKVLEEELSGTINTIAKDVKFQVEFNPAIVSEYRLIGYENRKLEDEDFDNDKKDAGDIGAGHRVTALYEIILADEGTSNASNLKYQENNLTQSDEWLTVNIRYKEPDEDTSKLISKTVDEDDYVTNTPSNIDFASCVAQFGMLLRDSEYKGSANYNDLLKKLDGILAVNTDEYKEEFASLVESQMYN